MVSMCHTAVILSYIFNSSPLVKYKRDSGISQGSSGMQGSKEFFISCVIMMI